MDTRRPIKDTAEPKVLSVAFNNDCTRFACGLDDGLRSAYTGRDVSYQAIADHIL
jgi:hypothetical protein